MDSHVLVMNTLSNFSSLICTLSHSAGRLQEESILRPVENMPLCYLKQICIKIFVEFNTAVVPFLVVLDVQAVSYLIGAC